MSKESGAGGWLLLIVVVVAIAVCMADPFGWFHEEPIIPNMLTEQGEEVVEPYQRMKEEEMQEILENAQIGDLISFGVIDNSEYIQWRVLDKEDGKIFVVSDSLLTVKPFHEKDSENGRYLTITWADSDIRAWLNNELYNSLFDTFEKGRILDTEVITPDGVNKNIVSEEVRDGGEDTVDKMFLLSYDEVKKYLPFKEDMIPSNEIYLEWENEEIPKIIRVKTGEEYDLKEGIGYNIVNRWWLRTPGSGGTFFSYVDVLWGDDVEINTQGGIVTEDLGIRPAMWIDVTF